MADAEVLRPRGDEGASLEVMAMAYGSMPTVIG
jgi:hypothetical protein